MIEIKRMKSEAGYSNCFELLFHLKDYIPTAFFEQHEDGAGAELYFISHCFTSSEFLIANKSIITNPFGAPNTTAFITGYRLAWCMTRTMILSPLLSCRGTSSTLQ